MDMPAVRPQGKGKTAEQQQRVTTKVKGQQRLPGTPPPFQEQSQSAWPENKHCSVFGPCLVCVVPAQNSGITPGCSRDHMGCQDTRKAPSTPPGPGHMLPAAVSRNGYSSAGNVRACVCVHVPVYMPVHVCICVCVYVPLYMCSDPYAALLELPTHIPFPDSLHQHV